MSWSWDACVTNLAWEVSAIRDVFSFMDGCWCGFDKFDHVGVGFEELLDWFGFDEVSGGFEELPDSQLVSVALLSRENRLTFQKPCFIAGTVIDYHGTTVAQTIL